MSLFEGLHFAGHCRHCNRSVERRIPSDEVGGSVSVWLRCRECGTRVPARSGIDDGATPTPDGQRADSWLLADPEQVLCWFPEGDGGQWGGEPA